MKALKRLTATTVSTLAILSLLACEKKAPESVGENAWPEMYVVRVSPQGQVEYAALSQFSSGEANEGFGLTSDDFESLIARSGKLNFQPAMPQSIINGSYPETPREGLYFVRQIENYSSVAQTRIGHGPPPARRHGHRDQYRRHSCDSYHSHSCGSRQQRFTHHHPTVWSPQFNAYWYQPVWYWQWNYYYYRPVYSTQNYLYWYYFYRW